MKTSFKIELKSTCDLCDRIVQKFLSFDQSDPWPVVETTLSIAL